MTNTFNRIGKVAIVVVVVFLTAFALNFMFLRDAQRVEGSVGFGNDYLGTTTDQTWTTLTPKVLKSTGGSLGSVVVTTVGTGSLTLYDATTTDITKRTGGTATSTLVLANFQITTALGTYTFDRSFNDGLIVVWVGTNNASTTITYR